MDIQRMALEARLFHQIYDYAERSQLNSGSDDPYPRVVLEYFEYLLRQIENILDKIRPNWPDHSNLRQWANTVKAQSSKQELASLLDSARGYAQLLVQFTFL
jgi:hypothetical protein